jgi:hypothetical protein
MGVAKPTAGDASQLVELNDVFITADTGLGVLVCAVNGRRFLLPPHEMKPGSELHGPGDGGLRSCRHYVTGRRRSRQADLPSLPTARYHGSTAYGRIISLSS